MKIYKKQKYIINVVTAEDILDFPPDPSNGRREFQFSHTYCQKQKIVWISLPTF
jgi:hypothetical protein